MSKERTEAASPQDDAAAARPAPERTAVDPVVSAAALHAWLERHRDDAVPAGEGEERYASYLKGPTGFCA